MVRKMGLCLLTNAYFVAPECETVLRIIKDFQRTLCSMTGFLTVVNMHLISFAQVWQFYHQSN